MIKLKTPQEIQHMIHGGRILRSVMEKLVDKVSPGEATAAIEWAACDLIEEEGAAPGFKNVDKYKWATCLPVNEQVVHTPPSARVLERGDILTIDLGVLYKGLNTDAAVTVIVGGAQDRELERFLKVGKETLRAAINVFKVGNHIGDISAVIERGVKRRGYHVIHQLTGHGIGRELHEDPLIPGFLGDEKIDDTPKIVEGMVLAIEVIYSMGTSEIEYEQDSRWSIRTADGSISSCFEHTVALYRGKPLILT